MANDNALSFVGKIKTAYKAAQKADGEALKYAIECGEQLALAFENVEAAKGTWKSWYSDNIPEIPQTTENLYRRLASAHADDESIFVDCKSIRDAMKELAKYDLKSETLVLKPERKHTPRQTHNGNTVTGLAPPEADTPPTDLKAELENAGADEIIVNIQDDADKLEEVAKASIVKLSPEKVCDALTKAWSADELRDLIKRVNMYLGPPTATTTTTTTATDFARRTFAQPVQ